jgi:hypothetical protein
MHHAISLADVIVAEGNLMDYSHLIENAIASLLSEDI